MATAASDPAMHLLLMLATIAVLAVRLTIRTCLKILLLLVAQVGLSNFPAVV
jgi:hypothetical protein